MRPSLFQVLKHVNSFNPLSNPMQWVQLVTLYYKWEYFFYKTSNLPKLVSSLVHSWLPRIPVIETLLHHLMSRKFSKNKFYVGCFSPLSLLKILSYQLFYIWFLFHIKLFKYNFSKYGYVMLKNISPRHFLICILLMPKAHTIWFWGYHLWLGPPFLKALGKKYRSA